jgi:hypothetical protein
VHSERVTAAALIAVVVSLLLVGVVSGTMLRHVVQVAPMVAAIVAQWLRPQWSRPASIPLFVFWLFIMSLIWMFLLGLARIVSGHFSPTEIALTVVIGISCLVGLAAAVRGGSRVPVWTGLAVCLFFGVLQIGAMWLSLRPEFENR